MACITVSTAVTGVTIGGKHASSPVVVRHLIATFHDVADVTTACGHRVWALPHTWQEEILCKKCPLSDCEKILGCYPPQEPAIRPGVLDYYDDWRQRAFAYALESIRDPMTSKTLAREIAVGLGYTHADNIVADYPGLKGHIVWCPGHDPAAPKKGAERAALQHKRRAAKLKGIWGLLDEPYPYGQE